MYLYKTISYNFKPNIWRHNFSSFKRNILTIYLLVILSFWVLKWTQISQIDQTLFSQVQLRFWSSGGTQLFKGGPVPGSFWPFLTSSIYRAQGQVLLDQDSLWSMRQLSSMLRFLFIDWTLGRVLLVDLQDLPAQEALGLTMAEHFMRCMPPGTY